MSRRGSFATAIAHSGVMFGNSKGQNFLFDVTRARFINNVPFKRCPILPYQKRGTLITSLKTLSQRPAKNIS